MKINQFILSTLIATAVVVFVLQYLRGCGPSEGDSVERTAVQLLRSRIVEDSLKLAQLSRAVEVRDSIARAKADSAKRIVVLQAEQLSKSTKTIRHLVDQNRQLDRDRDTVGFYDNTRILRDSIGLQQDEINRLVDYISFQNVARAEYDEERDEMLRIAESKSELFRFKANEFEALYNESVKARSQTKSKKFLNRLSIGAGVGAGAVTAKPGASSGGHLGAYAGVGIYYSF